jgi:hypothetical protein
MKNTIANIILMLFMLILLILSIRGLPGNPTSTEMNTQAWKENGPFELSPERGRFALLYSIVEDHSLDYSVSVARFVTPDLGYKNGHYVSLFAPAVSFLGIPGYIIGKFLGLSQVGTFLWIAFFALANVLFIRLIAIRLRAHPTAATLAALAFLFATPAYSYAVTLYEHHVSTFLILLGFYILIRWNSFYSLAAIWFLYAFSFTVDYPNFFLMLPIAAAAFFKSFSFRKNEQKTTINISFLKMFAMLFVIIPLTAFLFYNKTYYGSPFQLSGTVPRVLSIKPDGSPLRYEDVNRNKPPEKKSEIQHTENLFTMFKPRNMINGTYILLFSPDRGTLIFTPVMIIGIIGFVLAYRKKVPYIAILLASVCFTFLLYSMWGDPYGGWAFGARYMIPAYALLAIFIALALTYWRKHTVFLLFFLILFIYSVSVNTLGAITSGSNPPKVEAEVLSQKTNIVQYYTYQRNYELLKNNASKTYFFQTVAHKYISAITYYDIIVFCLITTTGGILYLYRFKKGELNV